MKSLKKVLFAGLALVAVSAAAPAAMAGNVNNINLTGTIAQSMNDAAAKSLSATAHADTSWGWANKVDANALSASILNSISYSNDLSNVGGDQNWSAGISGAVTASQTGTANGVSASASALAEAPAGVTDVTAEASAISAGNMMSFANALNFKVN
jgi:hypothetical protein